MVTVAFLLGNGKSRENIDLTTLQGKGTIVGCNALYRDFSPDVLLAIDQKMILEIINSEYTQDNYFVIPANRKVRSRTPGNMYHLPLEKFNTCGAAIIQYAGKVKADIAYLLGFDCYGGNMYEGTANYAAAIKPNRYKNFIKLYEHGMRIHPHTKYINVLKDEKDGITSNISNKLANYGTVDMDEFIKNLPKFPNQEPLYYHDNYREIQAAKKTSINSE